MPDKFPYEKYQDSKLWCTVQKALNDLVDNNDLALCTNRDYVVGYLVKMILDANSDSTPKVS